MNIVSFWAPRPEHPFFQDYTPFLDLLRLSCERFGHQHVCLTDDPTVRDGYVVDLPRSLMRAFITAQWKYLSDPANANIPTLLTGADCVLANDPDKPMGGAFRVDIAITTDDRFTDCRMNMGAMWIPQPCAVAHVWADALANMGDDWGDDQRAIYAALERSDLRVAEWPCDPYNLAPETPDDDCRRGVVLHFRGPRKRWMADYCHHWLGLGEGVQIKMAPNSGDDVSVANLLTNLKTPRDMLTMFDEHDRNAAVVGSGPSAEQDIEDIRDMATYGALVVGLNGAARWLIDNGITPDFGMILDMRPGNVRFVEGVEPRHGWLIASHCDPGVIAAANKVTLFHYADPALMPHLPHNTMMVGGAATVGLTALPLLHCLGFRHFHLFGYDSSFAEGRTHLLPQPRTEAESIPMTVFAGGREFSTSPGMHAQAAAFEEVCRLMMAGGTQTISVHGEGLLPTIARLMSQTEAAQAA